MADTSTTLILCKLCSHCFSYLHSVNPQDNSPCFPAAQHPGSTSTREGRGRRGKLEGPWRATLSPRDGGRQHRRLTFETPTACFLPGRRAGGVAWRSFHGLLSYSWAASQIRDSHCWDWPPATRWAAPGALGSSQGDRIENIGAPSWSSACWAARGTANSPGLGAGRGRPSTWSSVWALLSGDLGSNPTSQQASHSISLTSAKCGSYKLDSLGILNFQ